MSKVMETITFPGGAEPYQVRDGRIPENPGNYQYLVTDGNGQWGTADRLAYRDKPVTANVELAVSEFTTYNGKYWYKERASVSSGGTEQYDKLAPVGVKSGTEITIDGVVYEADEVHTGNDSNAQYYCTYIGNGSLFDSAFEDTGERYCLITGQNLVMGDDMKALYISGDFSTAAITNYGEENVKLIDPAKWLPEGYPYGEEHSVVLSTSGGVAFEGEDKGEGAPSYYLVYAGNVSDEAWNNLTVTNPSGEQLIDADSADNGNTRYFRDDNYYYTVLCRFDGTRTVTNSTGTITPAAGIYWRMGYNEMGGNGFTVDFGFVQTMAPKFLPETIAMKSELPIIACFQSYLQYDDDTGGNIRLLNCNLDYTTVYTGLDDDNFVCYVVVDSTRYVASKIVRNRDYVEVYYEGGIVRYNKDGTLTLVEN